MDSTLTQFYDDLKSKINDAAPKPAINVMPAQFNKGADMWKHKIMHHGECLKDKCCKHIILDIYCKILPLDKDYIAGHQGQMQSDVDKMLASKGMNATQYLTSAYESTNAPLLEYILRSTDLIGKTYMEEKEAEIKDAQDNDAQPPELEEPSTDDEEINSQLVDVTKDTEYETFIDALKKKTIDKIVSDISEIIDNEKDNADMTFDTHEESAVGVCMDYMQKKMWTEAAPSAEQKETMIGLAIRESTLRQFDLVFNQPSGMFKEFASRIRFGKGVLINESTQL